MYYDGEVREVIAISDLNSSYGSTNYEEGVGRVIARIIQQQPDLVICTGDMIAGQKTSLSDQNLLEMWDAFDEKILSPLSEAGIPVMFTVGNHDASKSPTFERDQNFARDFWEKQKDKLGIKFKNQDHFPFYYSAEFENLNVISWDASGAQFSDDEWSWIEDELAFFSESKPTIVLGHLPVYPVAQGRNKRGEYLAHGDSVLQLLNQYNVDAYFSGHHHAYYPGKRDSVLLIANGALGGGPRMLLDSDLPAQKSYTKFNIDESGKIVNVEGLKPEGDAIAIGSLPALINGEKGFVYRKDVRISKDLKREIKQDSLTADIKIVDKGFESELTGIITTTKPLMSDLFIVSLSSKEDVLTGEKWLRKVEPKVTGTVTLNISMNLDKDEARKVREMLKFGLLKIAIEETGLN